MYVGLDSSAQPTTVSSSTQPGTIPQTTTGAYLQPTSVPTATSTTVSITAPATVPTTTPTTVPTATPTTIPATAPTTVPPTTNETPPPTEGHKHSYTATHVAGNCTYSSHTLYTCTCGSSYTEGKTAGSHSFGQWYTYKEPTATELGISVRSCSSCGHREEKIIDKLSDAHNHSYVAVVTPPTCMVDGYTTYTCSCGRSYTGDKVKRLLHDFAYTVIHPTCTQDGKNTAVCKLCGYETVQIYAALGHDFRVLIDHPASCEHYGVYQKQCVNCAMNQPEIITPATGHDCVFTEFKEATCTTGGTRTGVCKTCHKTVTEDTDSPTGHVNSRTEVISSCSPFITSCEKTICTACDTVLTTVEKEPLPHKPTVTVQLGAACQTLCDQGNFFYLIPNSTSVIFYDRYLHYSDWIVEACPECNFIFTETARFSHTQREAAEIMLGYINEFRAETYGTHAYDMTLNDYLMGRCNHTINGTPDPEGNYYTNGLERVEEMALPDFSPNLWDQFNEWKNHAYIRSFLLNTDIKYFGFAYLENTSFRSYLVTRLLFAKDATSLG